MASKKERTNNDIEGRIVYFDGFILEGWAHKKCDSNPVLLTLYFDDIYLTKIWANKPSHESHENCWFGFSFSEKLLGKIPYNAVLKVVHDQSNTVFKYENDMILLGRCNNSDDIIKMLESDYFVSKWGTLRKKLDNNVNANFLSIYSNINNTFKEITGYELSVSYGTLLGCIRENDFIKHDDDYDLCYVSNKRTIRDVVGEMLDIIRRLRTNGYNTTLNNGGQFFLGVPNENNTSIITLDIFVGWMDGCYHQYFMINDNVLSTDVLPYKKGKFGGIEVNIPRNPEIILEEIYGKTWNIPDPFFNWSGQTAEAKKMQSDMDEELLMQQKVSGDWKDVKQCMWCQSVNLTYVSVRSDYTPVVQCERCDLLMIGRIPRNISDLYTKKYFEKKKDTSCIGYKNYLSAPAINLIGKMGFINLFASSAEDQKNILDVGCADGSLVELLQLNGWKSCGLDISDDAVHGAQQKGLKIEVSQLVQMNVPSKEFNNVSAFDLIEHLADPKSVLREIYRVLKDDGIFYFSTVNITQYTSEEYWFNTSLEHIIYYNKKILTNLLEEIFEHVEIIELEINGVSELFGVAKKKAISPSESSVFEKIKLDQYSLTDKNEIKDYIAFYCQTSKFDIVQDLLDKLPGDMDDIKFYGEFLRLYFQGFFVKIKELIENNISTIPLDQVVIWQAYSSVLNYLNNQNILALNHRDQQIQQRDQQIQNDVKFIQKKDEQIQQKDVVIQQRDRQIEKIGQQLQKARKELQVMKASKFWKLRDIYIHYKVGIKMGLKKPSLLIRFTMKRLRKIKRFIIGKKKSGMLSAPEGDVEKQSIELVRQKKHQGPLISIITPYYNRAHTIQETIDSVLSQTFQNFEYIIVDDGSDKENKKALQNIKNEKIRIIAQKNRGVSNARNTGIEKSKGKYILCLDSDDLIELTYLEKAIAILEKYPDIGLVYSGMQFFGNRSDASLGREFDALSLYSSNYIPTAGIYRRNLWRKVGGYTENIGYEDWEFWLSLVEVGAIGKLIPERLFKYRSVEGQSKYKDDQEDHSEHIEKIRSLHTQYLHFCKKKQKEVSIAKATIVASNPCENMAEASSYRQSKKPSIIIILPWLAFGGAERVVVNFCNQLKPEYEFSFITGLKSDNEWENKFKEISNNIYHLPNMFESEDEYYIFIRNYIRTRNVQILHLVHNSCVFDILPDIKKEFPKLKVVNTVFNTIAEHYKKGIEKQKYIDVYTTDNSVVSHALKDDLKSNKGQGVRTIHNGIDIENEFNPVLFDREKERKHLNLSRTDIAIFYIGRLSSEKCPDKYVDAALDIVKRIDSVKFFIIGDGPMKRDLVYRIVDSGYQNRVQYLGYQSEVARFLSAADIFVLPSKTEGFPLTNVEAMAMNTVVVASDVGGVSDAIDDGKNGFLMTPCSRSAIVDKLEYVINNKTIMSQITERAANDVKTKLTIGIMSDEYNSIYKDLLCHK